MVLGLAGPGGCCTSVLDFNADVTLRADRGPDGKGAAGQARVTVQGGIGREFGGAEDHLVCPRAAVQYCVQIGADSADLFKAAWVGDAADPYRGGLADPADRQGHQRVTGPDYQQALGRKIAAERRRRGLSQPQLARMIGRSVAWVSQVERGVRKVDRMSVLETLATALDVPLAELAAEAPLVAAVTGQPAGGLRLVLSGAHALRAMLNGRRPPAISTLRTRARKAWDLTHAGRYTDLTDLLSGLVPDLETAARAAPDNQRTEVQAATGAGPRARDRLDRCPAPGVPGHREAAPAVRLLPRRRVYRSPPR